jgi:ATPase subunit of ABC transporter with duplicated ATPase domains
MPASIVCSNLSFSTPDGRQLFSGIDLAFGLGRTGLIGRNGVGKSTLLHLIAGRLKPQAGSVTVSGTMTMFDQTVQVDPAATVADLFGMRTQLALMRAASAGQATVGELADIDWTLEPRMEAALARMRLEAMPQTSLHTLSGGQRTRAGLAALLFSDADFLLLDEPTNNLDRDGRKGALVVSHDRELLGLMDEIVELTSLGATRYGGNWSHYQERKALELAAARHDLEVAENKSAEIARATQLASERKARKDSGGRRKAAKGDMPRILLGGMKERAENSGGAGARLADARQAEAREAVSAARERIEVLQKLSISLPSTGLAAGKMVLRLDRISAGYKADRPVLRDVSLTVTGPERIAITGPNGSGKTTLLEVIAGRLAPFCGTVKVAADMAMLDQRASLLDPNVSVRDNFRKLNPGSTENACRAALARFRFRAEAALQQVSALSGGELLRAALACVLGGERPPPLLILDEPTNHLDLDSIAAIEAGLQAYDGALLVVSHDEAFLEALGIPRRIELPSGRSVAPG